MPEKALADAAKELRLLAEEVKKLLHGEFQTKATSKRMFRMGLIILLISIVCSFFFTIGTVSTCFLAGAPRPEVCHVMPGYVETQRDNEKLIEEFRELQQRSEKNERRIERLENGR